MDKSNSMKMSSLLLTALALLNFRVAAADTFACPSTATGSSCLRLCYSHIPKQVANVHLVATSKRYICHYSLLLSSRALGAAAMPNRNHLWQGKKLVSDSVSPVVKKLLEATSRDEFKAILKKADSASGIIVNKTTYSRLSKKGKSLGFELYPAAEVRKGWYKLGIKPDAAQASDVSDHRRSDNSHSVER